MRAEAAVSAFFIVLYDASFITFEIIRSIGMEVSLVHNGSIFIIKEDNILVPGNFFIKYDSGILKEYY
jgi:hypothetical protein